MIWLLLKLVIMINILGVDPGTTKSNPCGWSIINTNEELIEYGKFTYTSKGTERTWEVARDFEHLCNTHDIDKCVIEKPFSPNPDSLMTLHHQIGVIQYVLFGAGIDFYDFYTPAHIKKVATGNGRASKKLIQQVMCKMFGLDKIQKDTADAMAIALTGVRHINKEV